jgi:hypothetical protein
VQITRFSGDYSKDDYWLDCGSRKVRLFPQNKEYYLKLLHDVGFRIEFDKDTESGFATIVKAKKVYIFLIYL